MAESPPDPRRHAVLACFCFHSFVQCFCFMDFSTDAALVQRSLAMQDGVEDGLLYYGAFAATLPAMWISMWMLLRGLDRAAGLAMSLLIVAGAWLRFAALMSHSYSLAMLSTVVLGVAGGVIFTSFTFLPERWFPPSERGLATALAVQSNYAGWALGCLNPIMLGDNRGAGESGFRTFLLWQAIITSFGLPLQLMVSSRAPVAGAGVSVSSHTHATVDVRPVTRGSHTSFWDTLSMLGAQHHLATLPATLSPWRCQRHAATLFPTPTQVHAPSTCCTRRATPYSAASGTR